MIFRAFLKERWKALKFERKCASAHCGVETHENLKSGKEETEKRERSRGQHKHIHIKRTYRESILMFY